MKKSLQFIFLSLFFLSGFELSAQKGMKYTVFVLPQYVTARNADDRALQQSDNDKFRYAPLWGMGAGVNVGYNPSENFGIKTGVLYSHQGYRYTSKYNYLERYRFTTRLNYLKIPIMMGIHSNYMDNKAVFSFYAGYQMGFLLGGQTYNNVKEYVPPIDPNISKYPGIREIYNKYNGTIVMETGLDIKMTDNSAFNLKLRGDYGPGDAENKLAQYRITEGGATQYKYWWKANRAATHNLNLGLLIGYTYNMIPEVTLRKPTPEKIRKEAAPATAKTQPAATTEQAAATQPAAKPAKEKKKKKK